MSSTLPSPVVDCVGNPAAELAAARLSSLWFDLAGRTQLTLGGNDRAQFLHNFCTNDIRSLTPGAGCEAFITSVQGRILGHVFVYAQPERLVVVTVPGCAERLLRHLSRYQITEDVTFQDQTDLWHGLLLVGPQASAIVAGLVGQPVELTGLKHAVVPWRKTELQVRRNDLLGLPGYELVVNAELFPGLADEMRARSLQGGLTAFESLRIGAGFPSYGLDLGESNLAQEAARTPQAIHFKKGCYLGQEPIARIDALGHVNQEVRRVEFEAGPPIAPGMKLFAVGDTAKEVGVVTSSAVTAEGKSVVCLAMVRRSHLAAGSPVVGTDGGVTRQGRVCGTEAT